MTTVLEITNPEGFRQYYKLGSEPLVLGRGYDCDIILADEHVSAQHLSIRIDESGQYCISDCGSENGTHIETTNGERRALLHEITVAPGTRLYAGRTIISLHTDSTKVAPAKKIHHAGTGFSGFMQRHSWLPPLLLLLTLIELYAYAAQSKRDDYSSLVAAPVITLIVLTLWSACWAFVSRLTTHQANFFRQVGVISSIASVATISFFLLEASMYSIESATSPLYSIYNYQTEIMDFIFFILLFLLLCTHLKHSTRLGKSTRWKAALSIPVLIIAISFLSDHFDPQGPESRPQRGDIMLPLFLRASPIKTQKSFISDLDVLEKTAQQEGKKSKD